MSLIWMKKEDGEPVSVELRQVEKAKAMGYEECAPPEKVSEPAAKKGAPTNAPPMELKPGQVVLWKGDAFCICDERQIEHAVSVGWSDERDGGTRAAKVKEKADAKTKAEAQKKTKAEAAAKKAADKAAKDKAAAEKAAAEKAEAEAQAEVEANAEKARAEAEAKAKADAETKKAAEAKAKADAEANTKTNTAVKGSEPAETEES